MSRLFIKDTTFRDGVQSEKVEAGNPKEVLRAIQAIDKLGVAYHEVGFALASEAIRNVIRAAMKLGLQGKVAAFGRTHADDVAAIQELKVPVAVLVGKTRLVDATEVIHQSSADDNLGLIRNSVGALVQAGLEVIFDAEHFFQAFFEDDQNHALNCLEEALAAGANWIVLCDTNGVMTPAKIMEAVNAVKERIPVGKLGIHTHNDRGRAVANAEAAWICGVKLIEGTIGGVGERTGNADLCTLIPNLVTDYGASGVNPEQLARLTETFLLVSDILNVTPASDTPWVGASAFFTAAGMHQSGNNRKAGNYLHADPAIVGNRARVGVTDQSGMANLVSKAREFGIEIPADQIAQVASAFQELVDTGGGFGLADASFHLFLLRQLGELTVPFEFVEFKTTVTKKAGSPVSAQAIIRLMIHGEQKLDIADGDGPVHALDQVFRRMIKRRFPELLKVRLEDFHVRIIDAWRGTAARTRVRIEFTDGTKSWTTIGLGEDIIEASWEALLEGYTYKLVVNGHAA